MFDKLCVFQKYYMSYLIDVILSFLYLSVGHRRAAAPGASARAAGGARACLKKVMYLLAFQSEGW